MLLSDSDDFENLHDAMNEALNSNIQEVRDSDVSPIHKNIHCYYNSVNAFVGPQGTGKTYSAMDEILKIMLASPKTHLLIYISEFGEETRDPTIEKLKHLLKKPIVYITYEEAEDWFKEFIKYKRMYNDIKAEKLEDRVETSQAEEILNALYVDDFSASCLHSLVLFDDVYDNPLLRPKTFFTRMLKLCRKIYCSFFLTFQDWKGVIPEIKSQTTTAFIMGGFSKEKFSYICRQIASKFDKDDLWRVYKTLNGSDKLIINNRTRNVDIARRNA